VSDAKTEAEKQKYQKRVKDGLDRAFDDPGTADVEIDLDHESLMIFSDHHRGARDGADDFWRCERSYHAALGYYLETGHRLILLGDVEELWENKPDVVLKAYRDTLQLEREFHEDGRLARVWGNHDDAWRHEGEVEKHLLSQFPGLVIREALRLRVVQGGNPLGLIFLVHGHQGTLDSDRFTHISRLFVRYGWRPLQRRFKIPSTTPARDFVLRAEHDEAMFEWARAKKLVLIAGHTHRPVFSSPESTPERTLEDVDQQLERLRAEADATREGIATLRAERELVRTPPFGEAPKEMPLPCYFNTGCCSYGDGDVTGLELANGEIRLVRWLNDEYQPKVKPLAGRDLRAVFETLAGT
jgi:UDP-2,3-diacylglucosamine pyrophosphatase LpxH